MSRTTKMQKWRWMVEVQTLTRWLDLNCQFDQYVESARCVQDQKVFMNCLPCVTKSNLDSCAKRDRCF